MRVDLTGKFLSADRHVRIVTNLCVYWDQIFFTTHEAPAPAPVALPLIDADLHYRGFSALASDPEHVKPDAFDYQQVMDAAPWNPLRGHYTRYGSVEKLLARPDDQLVVMATGDEMTVRVQPARLACRSPRLEARFLPRLARLRQGRGTEHCVRLDRRPAAVWRHVQLPPAPSDQAPNTPEYRQYLRAIPNASRLRADPTARTGNSLSAWIINSIL